MKSFYHGLNVLFSRYNLAQALKQETPADPQLPNSAGGTTRGDCVQQLLEDLEYMGETFWNHLTDWADKDHFWRTREIGGIYDDNIEGGLYSK